MGLFGKLFDKKQCSICGADIGLLGNRKLEDGNLCKECASKLSPYFDDRRHSTVEQIADHLAYRERNRQELTQFRPSVVLGNCSKIHIELVNGIPMRFVISSQDDYRSANADIVSFKNVANCRADIRESRTEQKYRNNEGENVSYDPPRYEYHYDFYIRLDIADCPYYDDISFKLNPRTIELQTVEQKNIFTSFASNHRNSFDPMLYPAYREYKAMCDEVIQYISAGQRGVAASSIVGQNVDLGNVLSQLGAQIAGAVAGTTAKTQTVQANQNVVSSADLKTWSCRCGQENTGNFCQACGSPKPIPVSPTTNSWQCLCGTTNTGRFCSNCGSQQISIEDIECSECSWSAEPGLTVVPTFCPNCGKKFDQNDLR